jgi:hypothetical protein
LSFGLYSIALNNRFVNYCSDKYPKIAEGLFAEGTWTLIKGMWWIFDIDDDRLILLQRKARRAFIIFVSVTAVGTISFLGFIGLVFILGNFNK